MVHRERSRPTHTHKIKINKSFFLRFKIYIKKGQKQLDRGRFYYGSLVDTVRHGEVAVTVGECLVTLHSQTGSRKNTGSWAGYKTWPTFSSKAPPPKSSTVFQNIAVS